MIRWFRSSSEVQKYAQTSLLERECYENWIESKKHIAGYCTVCNRGTTFQVDIGVRYGERINLREGLVCESCHLGNRNRLVFGTFCALPGVAPNSHVALLEEITQFAALAKARFPDMVCSEYLGDSQVSGQSYLHHGHRVRHESITDLSYEDGEFDAIIHNDVLEHVFDYKRALTETARVLRPGGVTLFTTPLFIYQTGNVLRGAPKEDGTIEHYLPPEYHGDPWRPEGVYTFHYFGCDLLGDICSAGFSDAAIGINYEPIAGFTSNNHPNETGGRMLPIVLAAWK
jgi:SAM-dependent methyltransferase